MRISVKFAELTDPLFLEGNLGKKLDPRTRTGLVMEYDTDLRHLIVQYKGHVAMVQHTHSMSVANPADIGITYQAPKPTITNTPWTGTAQVSNPTLPKMGATGQELSTLTGKKKPITREEIKEE